MLLLIKKIVGEIRKAFSPFDWSIFLVTYLLAIAAAMLFRAVAIARATVVRFRLVAQAIAGIATTELGQCFFLCPDLSFLLWGYIVRFGNSLADYITKLLVGQGCLLRLCGRVDASLVTLF